MKIAVFNLKGGVGKTAISLNLSLETGYGVITNETFSPIEYAIPEDNLHKVAMGASFPTLHPGADVIYDLGGWIDDRIGEILESCDVVLVPTFIVAAPDVLVTQRTIENIEQFNKNIYVIANKCKNADELADKVSYPVLTLPFSKGFIRLYTERKSIKQQTKGNNLLAYNYRNVIEKFDKIIEVCT